MFDTVTPEHTVHRHRSLFLSDLHLGSVGSRADLLLKFLKQNTADAYILVGDILDIDHHAVARWSPAHQAVVDHLCARKNAGADIVYVRGNHDPNPANAPIGQRLPVEAADHAVHVGPDGQRYLVVHGDAQDSRILRSTSLRHVGAKMDYGLRVLDRMISGLFLAARPERRSAIAFLLSWANWGLYPSRAHERRLIDLARAGGFDGVICGHFHMARLHDRYGLTYANCGDWVDSFTALAADHTGRLHLLGGRASYARTVRASFQAELA